MGIDRESCAITCAVIAFIAAAIGGSLLVYYNWTNVCPPCIDWYTNVTSGGTSMCVGNGTSGSPEIPYQQCHPEYHVPGFAIGWTLISICVMIFVALVGGSGDGATFIFIDFN